MPLRFNVVPCCSPRFMVFFLVYFFPSFPPVYSHNIPAKPSGIILSPQPQPQCPCSRLRQPFSRCYTWNGRFVTRSGVQDTESSQSGCAQECTRERKHRTFYRFPLFHPQTLLSVRSPKSTPAATNTLCAPIPTSDHT